jgi:transglycosylase-like protein with SLT domain
MLQLLAFFGLAGAGIFFAVKARASTMENRTQVGNMDAAFQEHGARYGVDPLLLKAIATVESSLKPDAVNAADRYSVGLMQILYRPSDPNNLNSKPLNHFDIDGWNEATFDRLKTIDFNVKLGAQIIAWNLKTYGYPRGIAVFNAWDQRHSPLHGPFKNQAYVDKVIRIYSELSA